jgi:microcystin-dependent protein
MALAAVLVPVSHFRVGDEAWFVGAIAVSGESVVMPGWLAENGALVLASKYPKLFAEIGFAYSPTPGADPGGGQFYLPDYTDGRTFIPKGATNFPTRGAKGGAQLVALASDGSQDPVHSHPIANAYAFDGGDASVGLKRNNGGVAYSGPDLHGGTYWGPGNGGTTGGAQTTGTGVVQGKGGGVPASHQNMPPIRVVGGRIIRFL